MDFDPLHFKQFGDRNYKILTGLLITTAGTLLLSLVFFMITLASPHDTEVQAVNSSIAVSYILAMEFRKHVRRAQEHHFEDESDAQPRPRSSRVHEYSYI